MRNESGRSMVEMLGVLAIIGVLSVGGIAGYTMAMNKYKANENLATGSQCVVLAQSDNAGDGIEDGTSVNCKTKYKLEPRANTTLTVSRSGNEYTLHVTAPAGSEISEGVKTAMENALPSDDDNKPFKLSFS